MNDATIKLKDTTDKLISDINNAVKECIIDAAKEANNFTGVNPLMMKYVGYGMQVLNTALEYTKALTDELIKQHEIIEDLKKSNDEKLKLLADKVERHIDDIQQ